MSKVYICIGSKRPLVTEVVAIETSKEVAMAHVKSQYADYWEARRGQFRVGDIVDTELLSEAGCVSLFEEHQTKQWEKEFASIREEDDFWFEQRLLGYRLQDGEDDYYD